MAIEWHDDGHTITGKYDDRPCNVVMVIGCPIADTDVARSSEGCYADSCHVRQSAEEYGWEAFGGNGDFDLTGDPKPILWRYESEEQIELMVRE